MKPSLHAATSATLAAIIYAYSHSIMASVSCLVSGTLIDLDHVIDFRLFSGEKFTIPNFFSWCTSMRWNKMTIIFHSYELLAILAIAAYYLQSALLWGTVYGATLHLALDQRGNLGSNRLSPWFYLFGYRFAMGFMREKMQLPAHSPVTTYKTQMATCPVTDKSKNNRGKTT